MPLINWLSADFPFRDRLRDLERRYSRTRLHTLERRHGKARRAGHGRRAITNFLHALRRELLDPYLFRQFCLRLGELLSDYGWRDRRQIVRQLDAEGRFYCLGPPAPVDIPDLALSRINGCAGGVFRVAGGAAGGGSQRSGPVASR